MPEKGKKTALLVPQYNEGRNGNFLTRLEYFKRIADEFKEELDVVLIDDASSDDSLDKIKDFVKVNECCFFVAAVYPNGNKVGALFLLTLEISHEFVILSDFDTDIAGLGHFSKSLDILKNDRALMGCYFRMIPYEGTGSVFDFQVLEYALLRSLYKFHKKEDSITVMPGAGSCYKREVLISIYYNHSGLRNGEDREATMIGLKFGYKAFYFDEMLALTRPPLSFKKLIAQRIRWNLGYLETFHKERKYYWRQIAKCSRIGMRSLLDIILVACTVLLPLGILTISIVWPYLLPVFLVIVYTACLIWCLNLIALAPRETEDFKGQKIGTILVYPILKVSLDYIAWTGAFSSFLSRNFKKPRNLKYEVHTQTRSGYL